MSLCQGMVALSLLYLQFFPSPGRFLRSRGRDVEITMILAGTRGANGVQQSKRAWGFPLSAGLNAAAQVGHTYYALTAEWSAAWGWIGFVMQLVIHKRALSVTLSHFGLKPHQQQHHPKNPNSIYVKRRIFKWITLIFSLYAPRTRFVNHSFRD